MCQEFCPRGGVCPGLHPIAGPEADSPPPPEADPLGPEADPSSAVHAGDMGNKRAVRILLECILVWIWFISFFENLNQNMVELLFYGHSLGSLVALKELTVFFKVTSLPNILGIFNHAKWKRLQKDWPYKWGSTVKLFSRTLFSRSLLLIVNSPGSLTVRGCNSEMSQTTYLWMGSLGFFLRCRWYKFHKYISWGSSKRNVYVCVDVNDDVTQKQRIDLLSAFYVCIAMNTVI